MRAVYGANPNLLIDHTDGRPLVSEWAYEHAAAILEAWLPSTSAAWPWPRPSVVRTCPAGACPWTCRAAWGHTPVYHYQHHGSGWHRCSPAA
jgi:hypothetical protein